jgi:hypothetical protein
MAAAPAESAAVDRPSGGIREICGFRSFPLHGEGEIKEIVLCSMGLFVVFLLTFMAQAITESERIAGRENRRTCPESSA